VQLFRAGSRQATLNRHTLLAELLAGAAGAIFIAALMASADDLVASRAGKRLLSGSA
jgi:hypothetical protein